MHITFWLNAYLTIKLFCLLALWRGFLGWQILFSILFLPQYQSPARLTQWKEGNLYLKCYVPVGKAEWSCSKLSSGLFPWENPAQLSWGWEYPAPEKKYFPLTGRLFLPTALLSPLTAPSWSQHFFKNPGILVMQSSAPHRTEGHLCRLRNSVKVMKRMRCLRGSDTSKNLTLNEFSEIVLNTEKRIKCWNLIQTEKSTRNRKVACSTL